MAKAKRKTATKAATSTRSGEYGEYIVRRSYCRNRPGSRIQLDATTAAPLVRDGILEPAEAKTTEQAAGN